MIKTKVFPDDFTFTNEMKNVIEAFKTKEGDISSEGNSHTLHSNEVLNVVSESLIRSGFKVEVDKKHTIHVNVKTKEGKGEQFFYPDAFHFESKTAIEVEAGMAVANYRFLKDFLKHLFAMLII